MNKTRDLTKDEREALKAKYPKAKAIAVDNFLMTVGGQEPMHATLNMHSDAKSYKWNAQTVSALKEGIRLACVPRKEVAGE